ncbi:hypothetical protein BHM03_00032779, partial [Ensete ventricosum]
AWIEILHNSSFPWIALKLSREWTPPMMMLDWASGRWVMGLFAESLVVFVDKGHYHCEDCGICRLALHLSFDLACYCT